MGWFHTPAATRPGPAPRLPTPAQRRCHALLAGRYGRERVWSQRVVAGHVVDFWFERERVVLEVDGPTHDGPFARKRDEARDRALRAQGHSVLRVPERLVDDDPARLVAELDALLTRRRRLLGRLISTIRRLE